MIISQVLGGLGNQMFQYAAGRALSLMTDQPLLLDLDGFKKYKLHHGFELDRVFNATVCIASKADVEKILGWRSGNFIKKIIKKMNVPLFRGPSLVIEPYFNYWQGLLIEQDEPRYLMGYWQSEKYFKNYESNIRNDFKFKSGLEGANHELSKILKKCESVSLHIRRGDYVTHKATTRILEVCSLDYYNRAIYMMSKLIPSLEFFIFSDEPEWVSKNLKIPFKTTIVSNNYGINSHIDMHLMSLCKHHIISNSTFAWWGAWLNPNKSKIVIAPRTWFVNGTDDSDLLPTEWIRT